MLPLVGVAFIATGMARVAGLAREAGVAASVTDPNFFHPGSWIRIKELKYFNPQKLFLSSRKYGPGCSSRNIYPSRIQGSKRHRIPEPPLLGSAQARARFLLLVLGQARSR